MVSTPSLPSAAHEIADSVLPTDEEAEQFLHKFPLVHILETLQRGTLSSQATEFVCAALKKVFSTSFGVQQLPAATPYALEALGAPSHALRRLGCQQLGAALPAVSADQQQRIAGALVEALTDKDTGVGCEAAAALQQYGSTQQGFQDLISPQGAGQQLSAVLACSNPVVRMRAIALVIGLGGQSENSVKALQQSGLLQPLVKELTNVQDPLTCLSALSLLKEQVEQASSSRLQSLLANFFLPHLEQLLRQADSIVKPMAMQVAAALSAVAVKASTTSTQEGSKSSMPACMVISSIKQVLDVNGRDDFSVAEEQAALDALSELGMQQGGAQAILLHPCQVIQDVTNKALGRAPSSDVTLAAVHALATIAGAERSAAVVSSAAEEALKAAVYDGAACSSHQGGPAHVLLAYLEQPFTDLRIAAYRLATALGLRAWGAGEMCLHPGLLHHLCNPKTETSRQGCQFRYACLQALAATTRSVLSASDTASDVTAREILTASAPTIQLGVSQGVYGSGQGRAAIMEHQVATMQS
ncbi:TPA: hypothetical protein ACH3X2_011627 [Trebouxia sp. C0005]